MKRTIIYLSIGRLTDKLARDWYIDYLVDMGVPVEYWDIVSLVREQHSERGARNPDYLHVLHTYDELETRLRAAANRDALYVVLIPYIGQFTRIFRLLAKYGCRTACIAWGAMPRAPRFNWRRLSSVIANPAWYGREIFYRARASAFRRLGLVKPFAIVFAAGRELMAGEHYATKVVPINLCDYDNYIKVRGESGRLVAGRYAVFLDANLPGHSDMALCGYRQLEPSAYFQSLKRFFDRLERQHGVSVVVAAHPRADYEAATFGGRQIHRLATAELVKNAEFVLCHLSTAVSYAVLNAKPVVFIYTQGMADAYQHTLVRMMYCYADYLGSSILNVDEDTQTTIAGVNAPRYEAYKYNFLTTPESEQVSTREIFLREVLAVAGADAREPQWLTANR